MPSAKPSSRWVKRSVAMMAQAYTNAAVRAMHSPAPSRNVPPPEVSSATPTSATAALRSVTGLGAVRRSALSSSGTNRMAIFSSRDTVPESTVFRANISQDMTTKNNPPSSAPRPTVRREI